MEANQNTEDRNIELDLDITVVSEEQGTDLTLSDLYGIPVFFETTETSINEYENNRQAQLSAIEKSVFDETIDKEKQTITLIREQVFAKSDQLTQSVEAIEKPKTEYTNVILGLEIAAIIFMLLLVYYIRRRKRAREKKIDDINHFSGQEQEFN